MRIRTGFTAISVLLAAYLTSTNALDHSINGINYDCRIQKEKWAGMDKNCKEIGQMTNEFRALRDSSAQIKQVRIYSMECADRVISAARSLDMKVWLGIWSEVRPEIDAFNNEMNILRNFVQQGIISHDYVSGIQVGSEALYRYYIMPTSKPTDEDGINKAIQHLKDVRNVLRENHIHIPVTIADVIDAYNKFPQLYKEVDVVSVNQFSFWENVQAEKGVSSLFSRIKSVVSQSKANGKPVIISETGWTSGGSPLASPQAQARYLKDFLKYADEQNMNYYYFSSFNLPSWPNETEIEKNFGLFTTDRVMKNDIQQLQVGNKPNATRIMYENFALKAKSNGTLYFAQPTALPNNNNQLDEELWYYDVESRVVRSKSTNKCLDTYDNGGKNVLHLYDCDSNNANQKWNWWGNTMWSNCGRTSPDTGMGVCMEAVKDGNSYKVGVNWCVWDIPSQKVAYKGLTENKIRIQSTTNNLYLREWYSGINGQQQPDGNQETTQWVWDISNQLIRSVSNGGCLDAYQAQNDGIVHVYQCNPSNFNQRWQYNDVTGQFYHNGFFGKCLNVESNGKVSLKFCNANSGEQSWKMFSA